METLSPSVLAAPFTFPFTVHRGICHSVLVLRVSNFLLPGASAPEKGPFSPGSNLEPRVPSRSSLLRATRGTSARNPRARLLSNRGLDSLSSPFRRRSKSPGLGRRKERNAGFMTYYYVCFLKNVRGACIRWIIRFLTTKYGKGIAFV